MDASGVSAAEVEAAERMLSEGTDLPAIVEIVRKGAHLSHLSDRALDILYRSCFYNEPNKETIVKACGVPVAVATGLANMGTRSTVLAVMQLFSQLGWNYGARQEFSKGDGPRFMCLAMEQYMDSADMLGWALSALKLMISENGVMIKFAEEGGTAAVLQALDSHPEDGKVTQAAAEVLQVMLASEAVVEGVSDLAAAEAILARAVQRHQANAAVASCHKLWLQNTAGADPGPILDAVESGRENVLRVCAKGRSGNYSDDDLLVLVASLRSQTDDADLMGRVGDALVNLFRHHERNRRLAGVVDRALGLKAVDLLFEVYQRNGTNEVCVENLTRAICTFASPSHPRSQNLINERGYIGVMFTMWDKWRADEEVTEFTAYALYMLMCYNEPCKATILRQGGVAASVDALKRFRYAEAVNINLLRVLEQMAWMDPAAVVEGGALEGAITSLSSFPYSRWVAYHALEMVRVMAQNPSMAGPIKDSGITSMFRAAIAHLHSDRDVMAIATEALKLLSDSEAGLQAVVDGNVGANLEELRKEYPNDKDVMAWASTVLERLRARVDGHSWCIDVQDDWDWVLIDCCRADLPRVIKALDGLYGRGVRLRWFITALEFDRHQSLHEFMKPLRRAARLALVHVVFVSRGYLADVTALELGRDSVSQPRQDGVETIVVPLDSTAPSQEPELDFLSESAVVGGASLGERHEEALARAIMRRAIKVAGDVDDGEFDKAGLDSGDEGGDAAQQRGGRSSKAAKAAQAKLAKYQRKRALVVGINDYNPAGAWKPLEKAVHDAEGLVSVLSGQLGFSDVRSLLNGEATKAGIDAAMKQLGADAQPNDLVIIAFFCHGHARQVGLGQNKGYVVPVDAVRSDTVSEFFPTNELRRIVAENYSCRHIVMLCDFCFSGCATRSATGLPSNAQKVSKAHIAKHININARYVLSSGSAHETVADSGGEDSHSPFTGTLIRLLRDHVDSPVDIYSGLLTAIEGQTPCLGTLPLHEGANAYLELEAAE